ncbi:N-acetylmuramoyl-L-alanine amidase [Streptomyces sp. NBC_01754]|uniref:peptidoglycan recognition protein family protein n=1 Tax=Streptomyces sp. NBC_01754 TaxID=2975930 RepID=UPI002DDA35D6|nr:peptidoglycan recognition family protein [Streptomyces sp. NBC_01754]WSC95209.1 N-acetylmuramoyl-L-alanine amidase [Streptomyces sp. NBC_01754]
MAEPLSAAALLKALRDEGVAVTEVGNWRTHNRNAKGAWGPVNGSIVHHTVTKGTASTVAMCRDGYTDLPGPLCHGVIAKDGRVHLVGWGRANHAGGGDPRVLDQVIAESYDTRPTPPTKGNSNGVDGNARFYGWECENLGDGKDPWPAAQYDAIVRVQAAVCRAHGWTAKSAIGHLEWSSDKIDPRGFTMPALRADVAERLKHPASWTPTTTPSKETAVALTNDDVKKLWRTDGIIPSPSTAAKGNEYWAASSYLLDLHLRVVQTQSELASVHATVRTLAEALAARDDAVDVDALIARIETAIKGVTVRLETEH